MEQQSPFQQAINMAPYAAQKLLRDAEHQMISIIQMQAMRNIDYTRLLIRQRHMHGRRRKAELRSLLRYLKQALGVVKTATTDVLIRVQAESDIEQAIVNTRLSMGKATRCSIIVSGNNGTYIPHTVIAKRVNNKLKFTTSKD